MKILATVFVAEDKRWDGLKGYVTNADLKNVEAVSAYYQLYNVEQSFRIAKSKLEIRPIFHFNPNRIKAHICICFVALKVYRELGRLLKANNIGLSVDAVLNIPKPSRTSRSTCRAMHSRRPYSLQIVTSKSSLFLKRNFGYRKTVLKIRKIREILKKKSKSGN